MYPVAIVAVSTLGHSDSHCKKGHDQHRFLDPRLGKCIIGSDSAALTSVFEWITHRS